MKANYTPEHPEIKKLMDQIRELESQPAETVQETRDPQIQAINVEIANLERDAARIKARIGEYQQRVENTPKAEQEMATLQRDYQITQENYQRLLDRLYEARRAESLEKRQQGEQFRVLDLAQPPRAPVRPNFLRLGLVFLVLGLGSGSGLLLLMELMDNTVKGIRQVEELSGNIPCISAVPLAMTEADKDRSRRKTMILIAANIVVVVVGSVIVVASKLSHVVFEPPINLPF
ncbi:MAG: tyrosine kinase [bacterium ADurb.Bin431]|nr:MAG: tyrosine kinase [bacterium ADurb.Bin431]